MAADKSLKDLSNAIYKIAENSPKIQKDVKDIRDAVCGTEGILESLSVINKNMEKSQKKDIILRTSENKQNDTNNKKLLKSTNSITSLLKNILGAINNVSSKGGIRKAERRLNRTPENRLGGKFKDLESISRSVEIIERLKNIKFVDFVFGKKKMKRLSAIMMSSLNLFRQFKNKKEAESTISFINSSIDIIKKLGKIWYISKPAQLGVNAIEKVFLGKKRKDGGLLGLFRKINKDKRYIDKGKKTMRDVLKTCGSFLLTTMTLTGIAALSIPAMVGALLMRGVIYLLIGTYKILSKSTKSIIKGSAVLLLMSTSVITFALGLGLMIKAVRGIKLKDIGLMVASIAGVGLSVAGIGLLAIPIAIGSASLLLMGASIGILGLALKSWKQMDAKSAMSNIKTTINDLKDAFGLNSKESTDGNGLGKQLKGVTSDAFGFASTIFQFGKTFFQVGSILLCVGVMSFTRKRLDEWKDYNPGNAISNIKNTMGGIKEALGLNTHEPENYNIKGLSNQLGGVVSDSLGFASTIFQFGKTFFQIGSILLGVGIMGFVRKNLDKWNDYDPGNAISNIKNTLGGIKEALGLDTHEPETLDGNGLGKQLKSVTSDALGFASTIFQFGKTFFQVGSILLCVGIMGFVRKKLDKWNDYDPGNAISNIKNTLGSIKDALGLNTHETENNNIKGLLNQLGGVVSDALGFGTALLHMGKMFFNVGSILLGVGIMGFVRKNLDKWNDYNPGNAISNIKNTMGGIKEALGLDTHEPETHNIKGLLNQLGGVVSDALGFGTTLLHMGKTFFQMGSIFLGVGMMNSIRNNLEKWSDYNSTPAIGNIKKTISNLKEAMGLINNNEENEENTTEQKAKWYERVWEGIKDTGKKISTVASGVANGIKSMTKLSSLVDFASGMADIKDYLSPYDNYDSSKSIGNIKNTVINLLSIIKDGDIEKSKSFKKTSENIKDGLKELQKGFKGLNTIEVSHTSIDKTVKSINMLDLEKATVMTDMFRSFAKIGDKPFNKFTDAVNKFVKSCNELITSMDKLGELNESGNGMPETINVNSDNSSKNNRSFYIENTNDLAKAIAEAIKSLPINVENNMSDIRLVVDGMSGKKVILSLE